VIYLAAVVAPTLIVLTLGILAARRQHQANEALRSTARRLQEERIVEEVTRDLTAQASEALADPAFAKIAVLTSSEDPMVVDTGRAMIADLQRRHPVVREVFVVADEGVRYPRVAPSFPKRLEDWLTDEPSSARARLSVMVAEAQRAEASGGFAIASAKYRAMYGTARTRRVQALALAAAARAAAAGQNTSAAVNALTTLATQYSDTYTLTDRPHAVVAALDLARLQGGQSEFARSTEVARGISQGRWAVTPEQHDYFLAALAPTISRGGPFAATLEFGRALRASFGVPMHVEGGQVGSMVLAGAPARSSQLFYTAGPVPRTVTGIAPDLEWVKERVIGAAAASVAPGEQVRVLPPSAEHAAFRAVLPFWSVSVAPRPASSTWGQFPVLVSAYATGTAVVLGVLVMGIVLLTRDVGRETRLNRLRADLVSGVSHDLKTPLSVIRVYAETLEHGGGVPVADHRWFTSGIVQETERLRRVIDDVIEFSQIQQGDRIYRLTRGSLVPVVHAAATRFRAYAELHGFVLESSIPDALPAVRLDPVAVERAALNLLDNALKYSGDSKIVSLRAGVENGMVFVVVQDRGVGITPEDQVRVFDRFQRTSQSSQGGYGLGLYLVRHIMHAHGGRVELESVPGQGSAFRLVFPALQSRQDDAPNTAG
jgi:signal transduction histidine kinase